MIKLFSSFSLEEKIQFFINCQNLLLKYHPDSYFVFRENNKQTRKEVTFNFINNYKGYCYQDEKITILFNKIFIKDENNPLKDFNIFSQPSEDYNTIVVDFVAFSELKVIEGFYQSQYKPEIKWILYIKNNKTHLLEPKKFLEQISSN